MNRASEKKRKRRGEGGWGGGGRWSTFSKQRRGVDGEVATTGGDAWRASGM